MEDDETASYYARAALALREKAEREGPKPLTLDELRQMDDEPVWVKEYELYGIVDVSANFGNLVRIWSNAFYCVEGQDDFTAYRYKPKAAGRSDQQCCSNQKLEAQDEQG